MGTKSNSKNKSNEQEPSLEVLAKHIRRFRLKRNEDASGVSGEGYVAEGVQFSDGTCVLHWNSVTPCTAIYRSPIELTHIHGHGGKTEIVWLDKE